MYGMVKLSSQRKDSAVPYYISDDDFFAEIEFIPPPAIHILTGEEIYTQMKAEFGVVFSHEGESEFLEKYRSSLGNDYVNKWLLKL